MIPIMIFLAFLLFIWVFVMVYSQKRDIAKLKEQLQYLSAKVFPESSTEKAVENKKADLTVPPIYPHLAQMMPATPPSERVEDAASDTPLSGRVEKTTDTPLSEVYGFQNAASDKPTKKRGLKGDVESWLGRNVIGITASVLVFIGLVFLGMLVYEHITEIGKIIAMYLISSVILGLGIGLTVKKSNNFTLILTGCGCGSFFISILLTHIYFNKITALVAFSLLLVWMAGTLLLSKKFASIHLSIVAHIGMAVSICFAFAQGLSDENLVYLLIYQGVAIAIVLLGNIFCCKKTYNFGVIVSLVLTIITSMFMWDKFVYGNLNPTTTPFETTLPTALIAGAFFAQFLLSSFLSYLLSVSTTRLKSSGGQIAIHFANKALWITSLIMNVYFVVYRIAGITCDLNILWKYENLSAVMFAVLITLAVILIHAVLTLILSLKVNFNGKLETISILLLTGVASILLIVFWDWTESITGLIGISLLLILASHIAKNIVYSLAATIVLLVDALFMLFDGFEILSDFGTIFLALGYLVGYILIIALQWVLLDSERRASLNTFARLLAFFLTELSLIAIFLTSFINYDTEILLITLTLLNTILYILRFDREKSPVMQWAFKLNEFVLLSVVSAFIAFGFKDVTSSVLYMVLTALAFVLAFLRIRSVLARNNHIENIWSGLKLTILVLAFIEGNTSLFEQTYIFSIVCMLTALTCIVVGFIGKAKTLRYYGLAITLTCILKLVTFDVTNLNTLLRVLTFIGGGVICFIISAIYNYTSKKLLSVQNNDIMKIE